MFLKKRNTVNQFESRRNFLEHILTFTVNNTEIHVCQTMFLQTLAISNFMINNFNKV